MIVGSYYVTFRENDIVKSLSQDIEMTRNKIGKAKFLKSNHFTLSTFLVQNAELAKVVEPIENITFDKLKGKSLGCPSNILFWNDQQKQVARRIQNNEHTLLMGDYGTGY